MSSASGGSTETGFSLLEILVALVILSSGLGVLYHSAGLSTRIVQNNQHQISALTTAESLLTAAPLMMKESHLLEGQLNGYEYAMKLLPLPEHPLDEEYPLSLLEVSVNWSNGLKRRQVQLYSVVPGEPYEVE